LEASLSCVVLAATFDKNDMFAKPFDDEVWKKMLENAEIRVIFFMLRTKYLIKT